MAVYVLDTNIISEVTKPAADWNAICWIQDHEAESFLTTVTIMELNYGIMRLPEGRRKASLRSHIDAITKDCGDRILDFDSFSAYLCAMMRCKAQAAGRVPEIADLMIAAICQRHDAVLVTHNMKDFDYIDGLEVIDPFAYESPTLFRLKQQEEKRAATG